MVREALACDLRLRDAEEDGPARRPGRSRRAAITVDGCGLPAMPTRLRTVDEDVKTTASNLPVLIASRVGAGGGAKSVKRSKCGRLLSVAKRKGFVTGVRKTPYIPESTASVYAKAFESTGFRERA